MGASQRLPTGHVSCAWRVDANGPAEPGAADEADQKAVCAALQSSVGKARAQDRLALACVLALPERLIGSGGGPSDVLIEWAVDPDDEELAAVTDGSAPAPAATTTTGNPAQAALYGELPAGSGEEKARRTQVLAALDRAMTGTTPIWCWDVGPPGSRRLLRRRAARGQGHCLRERESPDHPAQRRHRMHP